MVISWAIGLYIIQVDRKNGFPLIVGYILQLRYSECTARATRCVEDK